MILSEQVITIKRAKHLGAYKVELLFNDDKKSVIDFYPFLSSSLNPLINKYLDPKKFSHFNIDDGDLEWNDYDLCFPIADLYENKHLS